MIMNDRQIRELVATEQIISPFVGSKIEGPASYGLSGAGYDIRLGVEFGRLKAGGVATAGACKLELFDSPLGFVIMEPGDFLLAHSVETIRLPNYIQGEVKDKSTWARLGIALQNTVLEPGWSGQITLEISNGGDSRVQLITGLGIAQVIFNRIEPCDNPYIGKYQDQTGVTGSIGAVNANGN